MSSKEEFLGIIDNALRVREAGNEKFKGGDLIGALRDYHTVLLALRGLETRLQPYFPRNPNPLEILGTAKIQEIDPDEGTDIHDHQQEEKQDDFDPYGVIKNALLNTHINSAAVHIKQERWQRALDCAQEAQRIEEKNAKATFREAQARIGLGEIQKGKALLLQMQKDFGPDAGISRTLAQLEATEKQKAKAKNAEFRGFLNKAASENVEKKVPSDAPEKVPETVATSQKAKPESSKESAESILKAKSAQVSKELESVAQEVKAEVAVKQGDEKPAGQDA